MSGRRSFIGGLALALMLLATSVVVMGDRLTLKDGTVLEGTVIKQSDGYWVKTANGASRIVPAGDVLSYSKSSGAHSAAKPEVATPKPATPAKPAMPAEPATPAEPAPPPPAQVTVSVPATNTGANPFPTGVHLAIGQQFIVNPNPTDTWSKGSGTHAGKKCDYKGYTDRPGQMELSAKVGKTGVNITAGSPAEAPEAGELFLFCADSARENPEKNVGAIHVTIIGPMAPSIASVERRAEAVETAAAAVSLWEEYIAAHPPADDLKQAKTELAKWMEMASGGAEKLNGKWLAGAERKALLEKAGAMVKEAMGLFRQNSTLQAIKKLEEAQSIYPNSFFVNFLLGYMAFTQNDIDKAMPLFERAAKIRPKSVEAAANIAVIHYKKGEQERGILELQKAAEMGDSGEIAIDLVVMLHNAPDDLRKSPKLKDAIAASKVLSAKYGLPEGSWRIGLQPVEMMEQQGGSEGEPPPGSMSSGTGFVINSSGLILTNRHVAKGGKSFEVTLQGGKKVKGEVVIIDDEQDLALLQIKVDAPMACVKFASHDTPGDGAECTVIGFPLGDRYTTAPKVTHGIVTSGHTNTEGADVMIDAKVNPGNSGGPILDKSGDVMAIVCMKTLSSQTEDTYGLGISAGKIRKFLEKNKVKVQTASASSKGLTTEEVATKIEPVTVLIVTTH